MIDPIEGIVNTQSLNQPPMATHNSTKPKPQATSADTILISDTAKAALEETMNTHGEIVINAKCGDLEAQQLLKQQAARKELLGI